MANLSCNKILYEKRNNQHTWKYFFSCAIISKHNGKVARKKSYASIQANKMGRFFSKHACNNSINNGGACNRNISHAGCSVCSIFFVSCVSINYLINSERSLVKTKSRPPIKRPTITLTPITTPVSLTTSWRVGQITFFSSSRVSNKKLKGVDILY